MLPQRSTKSKFAKSVFFEDLNDIDIYIEDTKAGYEKLFREIFSRVFHGKFKVKKVFPIGPRQKVIDTHKEQKEFKRPTLFVIDGDLHILDKNDVPNRNGLYKLPFYCIENILCDIEAFYDILNEEDHSKSRSELIRLFDYNFWTKQNEKLLFELFIEYIMVFQNIPTVQTVNFQVKSLVSSDRGDLGEEKIQLRIETLKKQLIEQLGQKKYENKRESLIKYFENEKLEKLDIVSGKNYLLPLLLQRLRNTVKTKSPNSTLKNRLSLKCNVEKIKKCEAYIAS